MQLLTMKSFYPILHVTFMAVPKFDRAPTHIDILDRATTIVRLDRGISWPQAMSRARQQLREESFHPLQAAYLRLARRGPYRKVVVKNP